MKESRQTVSSESRSRLAPVRAQTVGGWRRTLLEMGHIQAVATITAASIIMSMLMTLVVNVTLANQANLLLDLVIAFVVPAVIAPLASYFAVGLLFEVEHARAQLQIAVIRDNLTQLYNRGFFLHRLVAEIDRARMQAHPLSLILIDVDHFKAINDSFGHAAGDAVLEHLAELLVTTLRPQDLVARYGGEEFVALLPDVDIAAAEVAAQRIRAQLRLTAYGDRRVTIAPGTVTASLGVTCLGGPDDIADTMLARADRAMYVAKNAGRDRCTVLLP
jgi:diguanylate cyclase (GGDEF)-like protein